VRVGEPLSVRGGDVADHPDESRVRRERPDVRVRPDGTAGVRAARSRNDRGRIGPCACRARCEGGGSRRQRRRAAAAAARGGRLGPMIRRLVSVALHQPSYVLLLLALFIAAGIAAFRSLPVEAFPDVTDVQVTVITLFPGHAPEEVEKQITIPLEIGLSG